MNQGIPFARTLRALDADNFRASKLSLVLAVTIVLAWIWWALVGRVPQYESSTDVSVAAQTAVAVFPGSVTPLSPAVLRSGGNSILLNVVSAVRTTDGRTRVVLQLPPAGLQLSGPVSAEIEIGRASPATIVLRAAGLKR